MLFVLGEFLEKPPKNFDLIRPGCPADLNQKLSHAWSIQGQITGAFIADGTNGSQVGRIVRATHGLVHNMADLQPCLTALVVGMGFSCDGAAHLAGKTIPVENKSPSFFGDRAFEGWDGCWVEKKILPGFQIAAVIVGKNLASRPDYPF